MSDLAEPLPPKTENVLVTRAHGGDDEAFGVLMRGHYEPVFRLVQSIIRDEHAARDVCQEVWLSVWQNLGKFRGESKFSTWVHPIAVRRAIDHLRSRRRWRDRFQPILSDDGASNDTVEPATADDPRQNLEARERTARFERAIESLPPKLKAVLALREINHLSYDEIARNLGLRRGTVMSRLFNARRLLAHKLKDLPCE